MIINSILILIAGFILIICVKACTVEPEDNSPEHKQLKYEIDCMFYRDGHKPSGPFDPKYCPLPKIKVTEEFEFSYPGVTHQRETGAAR